MNKLSFFAGLGMLFLPFFVVFFAWFFEQDIDWNGVGVFVVIGLYVLTALFLIINGAVRND